MNSGRCRINRDFCDSWRCLLSVCFLCLRCLFFIKGNVCMLHGPVGWKLFYHFARRIGPPWRMSGVLTGRDKTFLQTTDLLTFVQNMIYSLQVIWLLSDCRSRRWRERWRSYRWHICWTDRSKSVSAFVGVKLLDILDEGPRFHWACSCRVTVMTVQPV